MTSEPDARRASAIGDLPVLSAEDVLIDLCVNLHRLLTTLRSMRAGRHRQLITIVDVAEVLETNPIDWRVFVDRVAEYGLEPLVFVALGHVREIYPTSIPNDVVKRLSSAIAEADVLLRQYGQWDLPEPRIWPDSYIDRCFDPERDHEIPPSRSLV